MPGVFLPVPAPPGVFLPDGTKGGPCLRARHDPSSSSAEPQECPRPAATKTLEDMSSCGPGGPPPGLVIITCVSAPESGSIHEMPLVTAMLPSFSKTVSKDELQALGGPTCLYLCAHDSDSELMKHVREIRRLSLVRSLDIGVRLFFYSPTNKVMSGGSAILSPFRETAVQAYADGAKYLHHAFDDAVYTRAGWMRNAVRRLHKSTPNGIGVFFPPVSVANTPSAAARTGGRGGFPSFVSRRHLEIFSEYAPYGLSDHAVSTWLAESYAALVGPAVVAYNHSLPRRRAHGRQALIECGQNAVARWLSGVQPQPLLADCSKVGAAYPPGYPPWPGDRGVPLISSLDPSTGRVTYGKP